MFPVLSPLETSWAPGERQTIEIVPGPRDGGRAMDWTLIDDVSGQVVAQQRFTYRLPVTRVTVETGAWPTGLYRGVIQPAGAKVDARGERPRGGRDRGHRARRAGFCLSPPLTCGAPTPPTAATR